jgi:cold shock protein
VGNEQMKSGTIKFYNEAKGFGFIQSDDPNDPDTFFGRRSHAPGARIEVGDAVQFDLGTDFKTGKSAAKDMRILNRG